MAGWLSRLLAAAWLAGWLAGWLSGWLGKLLPLPFPQAPSPVFFCGPPGLAGKLLRNDQIRGGKLPARRFLYFVDSPLDVFHTFRFATYILLLLPLFQLSLLPLIQNLGFGMASESARFSFTSLLTGSTFRPDPARPHFGSLPPGFLYVLVDRKHFSARSSPTPLKLVHQNVDQFSSVAYMVSLVVNQKCGSVQFSSIQLPTWCPSSEEYQSKCKSVAYIASPV